MLWPEGLYCTYNKCTKNFKWWNMAITKGQTNKKQIHFFWNAIKYHTLAPFQLVTECQHMTFLYVWELIHMMYGTEVVLWQHGHLMHDLTHLYALLCSIINDLDVFAQIGPRCCCVVWLSCIFSSVVKMISACQTCI